MMNSNVRNGGKEMFKIENLRVLNEKYEHLLQAACNITFPQNNNDLENFKACFSSKIVIEVSVIKILI